MLVPVIIIAICLIVLYFISKSDSGHSSFQEERFKSVNNGTSDMGKYKRSNRVPKVNPPVGKQGIGKKVLSWFTIDIAQDNISAAEKLISIELNKYDIEWYREVAFKGLLTENKGYARYDFLLITPKGIHLIEYDGKSSHSTIMQKKRDDLKNKFCEKNGIALTRYNSKHYYHLEHEIWLLMEAYGIKKRH